MSLAAVRRRNRTRWRADGRGQALVELAFVAPVLLLLLVGTLDLGRVFYYQIAITNAARVGAGYASLQPTDTTGIQTHVVTEASPLNLSPSNIIITAPNGIDAGNPIEVSVSYPFQAVTPLVSNLWGGGALTLRASATMVIQ